MKVRAVLWCQAPGPVVEDVIPEEHRLLLTSLLIDLDGQEDLYLSFIDRAAAGETVTDLYNQAVDVQLYPDGRAVLEELRYSEADEAKRGPPARTELTLEQLRQLILDWLAAKRDFYAGRAARAGEQAG